MRFLMILMVGVLISGAALAACPAPNAGVDDMVMRLKADGSLRSGMMTSGSMGAGENNVEGALFYDAAAKVVKVCNGTDWVALQGIGSGVNNSTQTSEYVREFSGVISSNDNHPACTLPAKIITIGRFAGTATGHNGFIDIVVYGHHRGYNNTSYYEYKHWALMAADYISSNLIASAGSLNVVNLWNGTADGNYNNTNISSGFDVRLRVQPTCGAGSRFTYVVKYKSDSGFTPNTTRSW